MNKLRDSSCRLFEGDSMMAPLVRLLFTLSIICAICTGVRAADPTPTVAAGKLGAVGDLYVVSYDTNQVIEFDGNTGILVGIFASEAMSEPHGITFGPNGNMFVTNFGTDNITEYDGTTGAFIRIFASQGLSDPTAITFIPGGNAFVGNDETGGSNITEHDSVTGALLGVFISDLDPDMLILGANGNLFVAGDDGAIRQFDATSGANLGIFASVAGRAEGMAFGPKGNLFVANFDGAAVNEFNGDTGTFIRSISGGGLIDPARFAFGANGNLYVANLTSGVSGTSIIEFDRATGAFVRKITGGGLSFPVGVTFKPLVVDCSSTAVVSDAGPDQVGIIGQDVCFSGSASSATGDIATMGWDLDGDGAIDVNGPVACMSCANASSGEVTFFVTDMNGCVATDTARFQCTSCTPPEGSVFVTGHDPDFHATIGPAPNGASNILQAAIDFARNSSDLPLLVILRDNRNPPSGHSDPIAGLETVDTNFVRVNAAQFLTTQLDPTIYSAIFIPSDFGGLLAQPELDALNARKDDILSYLNAGGGLVALAESNGGAHLTPGGGHFGFLPFLVSNTTFNRTETGNTVTAFGASLGLTNSDVNGNFSHNVFTDTGGMQVVDITPEPQGAFMSLAFRGLFEQGGVRDAVDLFPADGTTLRIGSRITISGRAVRSDIAQRISTVLINGEPIDSIDANGRFFKVATIGNGQNDFDIQLIDRCGELQTTLHLNGIDIQQDVASQFSDITAQLMDRYSGTTFNRAHDTLLVDAHVQNLSESTIDAPVMMAIGPQLNPSVRPTNPAGVTDRDELFYVMLHEETSGPLGPGEVGPPVPILFSNPQRVPVAYDVRWLAEGNRAPEFTSSPITQTPMQTVYTYDADAIDPDGHPISFSLEMAPEGMSVDPSTGLVTWSPAAADIGSHDVAIMVADNRGGQSTQRFALSVTDAVGNRPPLFTTSPVTQAPVGAAYAYDADAEDADGDTLTFSLLSGPTGLTLDPNSGLAQWPFALPGLHDVSIQVDDGHGGQATQSYVLTVGEVSTDPSAPVITSIPPRVAVVGQLYVYQPVAHDPDGDTLSYLLSASPSGMTIDAATGRIGWTPVALELGLHPVTLVVSDPGGASVSQSYEVDVLPVSPNLPPVFVSQPPSFAIVGSEYSYQAEAMDPEGEAVTYGLRFGPAGVALDATTGLLTWTPTEADGGVQTIAIVATDPRGLGGNQVFQVNVRLTNASPVIVSTPSTTIFANATYQYVVRAEDADGDAITYALVEGPDGMTINPLSGLVSWRTSTADVGPHTVTVAATDCCGGRDEQTFTLTVEADTEPPEVSIVFSLEPAPLGTPIDVYVLTSDNVGVDSRTLTVQCALGSVETLTLDSTARAVFQSSTPAICTFVATVTDTSGNTGTATRDLLVGDPASLDPNPPVIEVVSPEPGSCVTAPTDIVVNITDATPAGQPGSGPLTWTVQMTRANTDESKVIGSGTGEVMAGVVAQFDPTMLANDAYTIEIDANDGVQTRLFHFPLSACGDLKLGNFSISFTDLTIPVAGIPLVITRSYNSLDTTQGEFGAGWRLALPGDVTDSAAETPSVEPFTTTTRVFVTRPDGRRVGFTFDATPVSYLFPFIVQPFFRPDPGVNDKLELVDNSSIIVSGGIFFSGFFSTPFNPSAYTFTTKDGVKYTIDEADGLSMIEDRNGNTIEVRPDGLFSSTGVQVTFERDAAGRITRIIEPTDPSAPNPPGELNYAYDAAGNLVSFTDQVSVGTRFFYEDPRFPHYLSRIEDDQGRTFARNLFDEDGRLIAIIDPDGNRREFQDDTSARQHIQTDRLGNVTVSTFDDRGNLLSMTDGLGNTTIFTYDSNSNRMTITDPLSNTTHFTYDSSNRITSIADPAGHTSHYTYNDLNQIVSVVDPMGNSQSFTYDTRGNRLSKTDALGNTIINTYDGRGDVLSTTDPLGNTTQFSYDSVGNRISQTDALGNTTQFTHNAMGSLLSSSTQRTDTDGQTHLVTKSTMYDAKERPIMKTDARGNTSSRQWTSSDKLMTATNVNGDSVEYIFDQLGRRVRANYDDGTFETMTYDKEDHILTMRSRLGGVSSFEYDAMGRVLREVRPDGNELIHEYDAAGNQTALVRSGGMQTRSEYAPQQRFVGFSRGQRGPQYEYVPTTVFDSNGERMTLTYDADGALETMTDADGKQMSFLHDGLGRLTSVQTANGGCAAIEYDGNSQPTRTSDGTGNATTITYDSMGHLQTVTDAIGNTTAFTYDEMGDRLTQTDANGHTTRWDYDNAGHVIRRTLPLGMSETFIYNMDGTIAAHTDFIGRTTQFTYDVLRHLTTKTYPDGSAVVFTYAGNGKRQTAITADGLTQYQYDTNDRLSHVSNPDGSFISYLWDSLGRRTDVITPRGQVHYTYDSLGRLSSVEDPASRTTSYQYGRLNIPNHISLPNGASVDRTFDDKKSLTDIINHASDDSLISQFSMTFLDSGLGKTVSEASGRTLDNTYDALHRLVNETITDPQNGNETVSYSYDAVGNRLTRIDSIGTTTYTYDANDRIVTSGTTTFEYDDNGNLVRKTDGADSWIYNYDFDNHLVGVISPTGTVTTFAYDSDGVRVARSIDGAQTRFLVDKTPSLSQVLEERSADGTLLSSYVYGTELVNREVPNGVEYYHFDGLGSTRTLTDQSGQVSDRYAYGSFGSLLAHTGTSSNPFLFTGQQYDESIASYFLRTRYYLPTDGRFTSMDTFNGNQRDPISLNKYLYARSDPTTFTDPSGRGFIEYLASVGVDSRFLGELLGGIAIEGDIAVHAAVLSELSRGPRSTRLLFGFSGFAGSAIGGGGLGVAASLEAVFFDTGWAGYLSAGIAFIADPSSAVIGVSHISSVTEFVGSVFNAVTPSDYTGGFVGGVNTHFAEVEAAAFSQTAQSLSVGEVITSDSILSPYTATFSITYYIRLPALADLLNGLNYNPVNVPGQRIPLPDIGTLNFDCLQGDITSCVDGGFSL